MNSKNLITFSLYVFMILLTALIIYKLCFFYKKIEIISKVQYRIDTRAYQDKLQEIFRLVKDSSHYIRKVDKVELSDQKNILISLDVRKEIFAVTDGKKICIVSDDGFIVREHINSTNFVLFFYPWYLSCSAVGPSEKLMERVNINLLDYYKTIAKTIKLLPNLQNVKLFYLKPSYNLVHLYFWLGNQPKFYGGSFATITKESLFMLDKKLGEYQVKQENIKDIDVSEVNLSSAKLFVKVE